MQPIAAGAKLAAYHAHLQSSHDFRIEALVMNLNEKPLGRLDIIDGQKNFQTGSFIRSTATLTASDVDGALLVGTSAAYEGSTVFPDRLVQIRHTVTVPGYGEVEAIAFTGPPSAISRDGGDLQIELQDKAALGLYGSKPMTIKKGANAIDAIRTILTGRTGEFRYRLPVSARRLSKSYNVGWTDEAAPFRVAALIARNELGMTLSYSGDGYVICRPSPARPCMTFDYLVDAPPTAAVDFTAFKNAALVKGKKVSGFKFAPAAHPLSPAALARKGVAGWRPIVVSDEALKKQSGVNTRASQELAKSLGLEAEGGVSVVPMFHHDYDDVIQVGPARLRMREVSIPLGVGGAMSVGARKWVSRPVKVHAP